MTTTAAKAGYFEARFFHKVFGEEIAQARGHFSPINSVAFSPDGTSFVTGAEEGNVRLHHFDADYFTTNVSACSHSICSHSTTRLAAGGWCQWLGRLAVARGLLYCRGAHERRARAVLPALANTHPAPCHSPLPQWDK